MIEIKISPLVQVLVQLRPGASFAVHESPDAPAAIEWTDKVHEQPSADEIAKALASFTPPVPDLKSQLSAATGLSEADLKAALQEVLA